MSASKLITEYSENTDHHLFPNGISQTRESIKNIEWRELEKNKRNPEKTSKNKTTSNTSQTPHMGVCPEF